MDEGLPYAITQVDGACVLDLRGEIDLATGRDFAEQLDEALAASGELLVVDLTRIDFLGSVGLATLVKFHQQAQERGTQVRLVCGHATRRTIELTGLAQRFVLADTRAEVLPNREGLYPAP